MRRRATFWACCAAVAVLAGSGLLLETSGKTSAPAPAAQKPEQRRLVIRAGTLFTKEGVPINLAGFDASIQSQKVQANNGDSGKQIEDVTVRSGTVFIQTADLSKLLAPHVPQDKISDLSVETKDGQLKISGKMKKTLPVHFEIKGPVSITPDGKLALHEKSMKVDKLPMKGLADMLGMNPADVAGNSAQKGIQGKKDELIVDPNMLWGMPVQGKVSAVKVTNTGLLLTYGVPRHGALRASR